MTDAVNRTAQREAAAWVARRADGLDPTADVAFQRWHAADPRHRAAWTDLDAAWTAVNRPRHEGEAALLRSRIDAHRQSHQRRRRNAFRLALSTGLAAAAALVVLLYRPVRESPQPARPPATIAIRPHVQMLSDGSRVELNAGAEIAVDFSPERRAVRLVRGEALFTVAKNPARPFVVTAGSVEVRAVGTEFNVRLATTGVDVLVTEGRVAVNPAAIDPTLPAGELVPPLLVDAGAQARVPTAVSSATPAPAVILVSPAAVASALAWRERRVEFAETPLGETLAWFNRQNTLQLSLATPALARRRISGVYWSDDPEGCVRLLETSLSVRAERVGDTLVLRTR